MDQMQRERGAERGEVRGQQAEAATDPELPHRTPPLERRGDDEAAAEEEDHHAALAHSERLGRESKGFGPEALGKVSGDDHHRRDAAQRIEELEPTVAGRGVGRSDFRLLCGDRHGVSVRAGATWA